MGTWDFMNEWHLVLPPSRPSAWQLNWITKSVEFLDRSSPVAILGSTPEFRDLLYELGFINIFIFDKNESFYEITNTLRVYSGGEKFVAGDWLITLGEYKNFFHLVLSDLTSGNLKYDDRANFYNLIEDALVVDGVFCDKILTHPDELIPVDILLEKYSRLPLNLLYINYFSCEMFFCSEFLDLYQTVDSSLFYSLLDKTVVNQRVKAFVKYAPKITPFNCKWYYGRRWQYLQKDYCPNLFLLSSFDDQVDSPYYKRLKFFSFQKR